MSEPRYKQGDKFITLEGDVYTVDKTHTVTYHDYTMNGPRGPVMISEDGPWMATAKRYTPWFEAGKTYESSSTGVIQMQAVWEYKDRRYAVGHVIRDGANNTSDFWMRNERLDEDGNTSYFDLYREVDE